MTTTPQNFLSGRWLGPTAGQTVRSAVNGRPVACTPAEAIDCGEAVQHARRVGLPALMALDFQVQAEHLKALAKYRGERTAAALRRLGPHRHRPG